MKIIPTNNFSKLLDKTKQFTDLIEVDAPKVGRPSKLQDYQVLAIILYSYDRGFNKDVKSTYRWLKQYHWQDFKIPSYSNFINHYNRLTPLVWFILEIVLVKKAETLIIDSTPIPVCHLLRASRLKTLGDVAKTGYGTKGKFHGLKLHATATLQGLLVKYKFTDGATHDKWPAPELLVVGVKKLIGDTHYGSKILRKKIWRLFRCLVISKPHPKQKRSLVKRGHWREYKKRPRIETTFSVIINKFNLISSRPRSKIGYLRHYLCALLSYQLHRLNQLASHHQPLQLA